MREKSKKQLPLMNPTIDHPQARELDRISWILDQVLRAAIVKQMFGFSYELLPFHLADSNSLQRFCRIGIAGKRFKKSAIAKNVKRISPQTWERINRILTVRGKQENIEKGRQLRIDCTVMESNVHSENRQN